MADVTAGSDRSGTAEAKKSKKPASKFITNCVSKGIIITLSMS